MPLDNPLKIAHVQAAVLRAYAGRQKAVVFVYNNAGTYSYVAQTVIFRPQTIIDPEIPALNAGAPTAVFDMLMIAPISINFTGVVYIADTTTATSVAVAAAKKYEVIEAVPTGIIPAGTHYEVRLRRLR